jgi:hypothetical protein
VSFLRIGQGYGQRSPQAQGLQDVVNDLESTG